MRLTALGNIYEFLVASKYGRLVSLRTRGDSRNLPPQLVKEVCGADVGEPEADRQKA
jgi:hypothetical protein